MEAVTEQRVNSQLALNVPSVKYRPYNLLGSVTDFTFVLKLVGSEHE